MVVSFLPVAGALSTSNIFFLRDLSFYFWPEHLWIRNAWLNGEFPLWDPYAACGQAAASDPLRHIFYPPVALLRFVPSAELGFNLAVALPFPAAALGMYLFLRRLVGPQSASLGAIAFAASGPMLSTGNIINFAWAASTIPWVLLCVERLAEEPSRRRFALLAVSYAMLLLAGEGLALFSTAVLSAAYAFFRSAPTGRIRACARVVAAGFTGLALSGVLAVPFLMATLGSPRAGGADSRVPSFWSLHPLTLLESVSFGALGDSLGQTGESGWQITLNGGYQPLVYSVYFGIAVLAIAAIGALARARRWDGAFWSGVVAATLLLAMGRYTPVYDTLREISPILDGLRFPSKFVILTAVAVAVLTAFGWDSLGRVDEPAESEFARRHHRVVVALLSCAAMASFAVTLTVLFGSTSGTGEWLARLVGMRDPARARQFLDESLLIAAPRLAILSAAVAAAILGAGSPSVQRRRLGLAVLVLIAVADPILSGAILNPTGDSRNFGEPRWAQLVREGGSRVYVGGRLQFTVDRTPDPDDVVFTMGLPMTANSAVESVASHSAYTATFPAALGVRDAVSFDNAMLWPREYWFQRERLRASGLDDRKQILRKAAVGFYLVPWSEVDGAEVVDADRRFAPMKLWELDEPPARASVVEDWSIEPDAFTAIARGVEVRESVLIDRAVEPSGFSGVPATAAASIVRETNQTVSVEASAPQGGGLLVLRDSYANGWTATVDREPADIVRADGLFRGVRLTEGRHHVEFKYELPGLRIGIGLTSLTSIGLALFMILGRRSER